MAKSLVHSAASAFAGASGMPNFGVGSPVGTLFAPALGLFAGSNSAVTARALDSELSEPAPAAPMAKSLVHSAASAFAGASGMPNFGVGSSVGTLFAPALGLFAGSNSAVTARALDSELSEPAPAAPMAKSLVHSAASAFAGASGMPNFGVGSPVGTLFAPALGLFAGSNSAVTARALDSELSEPAPAAPMAKSLVHSAASAFASASGMPNFGVGSPVGPLFAPPLGLFAGSNSAVTARVLDSELSEPAPDAPMVTSLVHSAASAFAGAPGMPKFGVGSPVGTLFAPPLGLFAGSNSAVTARALDSELSEPPSAAPMAKSLVHSAASAFAGAPGMPNFGVGSPVGTLFAPALGLFAGSNSAVTARALDSELSEPAPAAPMAKSLVHSAASAFAGAPGMPKFGVGSPVSTLFAPALGLFAGSNSAVTARALDSELSEPPSAAPMAKSLVHSAASAFAGAPGMPNFGVGSPVGTLFAPPLGLFAGSNSDVTARALDSDLSEPPSAAPMAKSLVHSAASAFAGAPGMPNFGVGSPVRTLFAPLLGLFAGSNSVVTARALDSELSEPAPDAPMATSLVHSAASAFASAPGMPNFGVGSPVGTLFAPPLGLFAGSNSAVTARVLDSELSEPAPDAPMATSLVHSAASAFAGAPGMPKFGVGSPVSTLFAPPLGLFAGSNSAVTARVLDSELSEPAPDAPMATSLVHSAASAFAGAPGMPKFGVGSPVGTLFAPPLGLFAGSNSAVTARVLDSELSEPAPDAPMAKSLVHSAASAFAGAPGMPKFGVGSPVSTLFAPPLGLLAGSNSDVTARALDSDLSEPPSAAPMAKSLVHSAASAFAGAPGMPNFGVGSPVGTLFAPPFGLSAGSNSVVTARALVSELSEPAPAAPMAKSLVHSAASAFAGAPGVLKFGVGSPVSTLFAPPLGLLAGSNSVVTARVLDSELSEPAPDAPIATSLVHSAASAFASAPGMPNFGVGSPVRTLFAPLLGLFAGSHSAVTARALDSELSEPAPAVPMAKSLVRSAASVFAGAPGMPKFGVGSPVGTLLAPPLGLFAGSNSVVTARALHSELSEPAPDASMAKSLVHSAVSVFAGAPGTPNFGVGFPVSTLFAPPLDLFAGSNSVVTARALDSELSEPAPDAPMAKSLAHSAASAFVGAPGMPNSGSPVDIPFAPPLGLSAGSNSVVTARALDSELSERAPAAPMATSLVHSAASVFVGAPGMPKLGVGCPVRTLFAPPLGLFAGSNSVVPRALDSELSESAPDAPMAKSLVHSAASAFAGAPGMPTFGVGFQVGNPFAPLLGLFAGSNSAVTVRALDSELSDPALAALMDKSLVHAAVSALASASGMPNLGVGSPVGTLFAHAFGKFAGSNSAVPARALDSELSEPPPVSPVPASPLDLDLDTLPPSQFDDPPLPAKGPVFLKHLDVKPLEDYINWAVESFASGDKPSNALVKVTQYKPRDVSNVRVVISCKWCKLLEVPFEGMVDPSNKWNPNFLGQELEAVVATLSHLILGHCPDRLQLPALMAKGIPRKYAIYAIRQLLEGKLWEDRVLCLLSENSYHKLLVTLHRIAITPPHQLFPIDPQGKTFATVEFRLCDAIYCSAGSLFLQTGSSARSQSAMPATVMMEPHHLAMNQHESKDQSLEKYHDYLINEGMFSEDEDTPAHHWTGQEADADDEQGYHLEQARRAQDEEYDFGQAERDLMWGSPRHLIPPSPMQMEESEPLVDPHVATAEAAEGADVADAVADMEEQSEDMGEESVSHPPLPPPQQDPEDPKPPDPSPGKTNEASNDQTDQDDRSSATERTANGKDYRKQKNLAKQKAVITFASDTGASAAAGDGGDGFQPVGNQALHANKKSMFGIKLARMDANQSFSEQDIVAFVAILTELDPHLVVLNHACASSSAKVASAIKDLTPIELMSYFDIQSMPWGSPKAGKRRRVASLWVASDVLNHDLKQVRQHRRIAQWQQLTKIEIYRHYLKCSVTKQVAGLLGLNPDHTSNSAMKGRIEAHLKEHGKKKILVDIIPVNFRVGKASTRVLGIFTDHREASSAEAILKKHRMPMLSFIYASSKQSKKAPERLAESKLVCSQTRGIRMENMTEEQAQELRRFFDNSKDLPEEVHEDIVDVSGIQQPGVYYLKYVHLDEARRNIIMKVLDDELQAFGNAMQEGDAEPPKIADRRPSRNSADSVATDARTDVGDSDSEDSGRLSKVSTRAGSYAAAAAAATATGTDASTISSKGTKSRSRGKAGWNARQATKQIVDTQWLSRSLFVNTASGYESDHTGQSGLSSKASTASKPANSVNVGDGDNSDQSVQTKASALTNTTGYKSTRTMEEADQHIEMLEQTVQNLTADRDSALKEVSSLQQELTASKETLQLHESRLAESEANQKKTDAQVAQLTKLIESMHQQHGSGLVHPPSELQNPPSQTTEGTSQLTSSIASPPEDARAEEHDEMEEDNHFKTPQRANLDRTSMPEGKNSRRQNFSPSAEPPKKTIRQSGTPEGHAGPLPPGSRERHRKKTGTDSSSGSDHGEEDMQQC